MKPGYGRQSFLVVFDFDHTICDCNTDEVIPNVLGRSALQKKIILENNILNANYGHDDKDAAKVASPTATPNVASSSAAEVKNAGRRIQWTKLMDTIIAPFSREELDAAAKKSVFVAPGMRDVFDFLTSMQEQNNFFISPATAEGDGSDAAPDRRLVAPSYLEINIASDSNLLFIESALNATMPGVRERISQIHSNPYYSLSSPSPASAGGAGAGRGGECPELTEDERADEAARDARYNPDMTERKSRLLWYERHGSGCDFCTIKGSKPNMCKSKIIKKLLNTTQLIDPTVIFVGDGGNDYCPVLNVLRPRDFVFVRRGFPLHKILSTGNGGEHGGQRGDKLGGCCSIGLWQDPKELLSLFQAVMQGLPFQRLPTLARFLDLPSAKEFRAVTLRKRMVDIVRRTLHENAATVSASGRAAMAALERSVAENGLVPPLPGQCVVPAWLQNYAFVSSYGRDTAEAVSPVCDGALLTQRASFSAVDTANTVGGARLRNIAAAPRWGQLPWLHGEVYFYHLLWQYVMLRDPAGEEDEKRRKKDGGSGGGLINYISPYDIVNPLYSQHCEVARTQGMVSAHDPAIVFQNLRSDFIVTDPRGTEEGTIARVMDFTAASEQGQTVRSDVVPYHVLTDPEGNSILGGTTATPLPPQQSEEADEEALANTFFLSYHDIFRTEKRSVLVNFIEARVVPMLVTRPWAAPRTFAGTLLRWMLWGNGLDLSMFTVEQLAKDGEAAAAAAAAAAPTEGGSRVEGSDPQQHADSARLVMLRKLREEESAAAMAQDTHVVGNEAEKLAKYLRLLLSVPDGEMTAADVRADRDLSPANYRLDIVMDNVGVECIADLCLGLWFLHHAERKKGKVTAAVANTAGAEEAAQEILPTVTYHVKAQPYYVSDVTPRDFEEVLSLLEQSYATTTDKAATAAAPKRTLTKAEKEQRKVLRKVLSPFVQKVRSAFASGAFVVDADTVWTQPCEYRDLPPRLINRYFYTQTCVTAGSEKASKNISCTLRSRKEVFTANKATVEAKTALVIFKGDLNFRRMIGDRYWERSDFLSTLCPDDGDLRTAASGYSAEESAAVAELLQDTPEVNELDAPSFTEIVSAFWPTTHLPVACIRTIKSECCVGVSGDRKVALDAEQGRGWRVSGKYGVILFAH